MTHTNEWAVSFHKDGNSIVFYETPDWVLFVEALVSNKIVSNVLLRFTKGFQLWNNILGWTHEQRVQVYIMDAPIESLQFLVPDEQWFWDEDYEEDE